MPRIPIDKIYMQIAYQTAKLSYAERRKVGCIIIKDEQIVSFGYNGTPKGFDNCCEVHDTTRPEVLHAAARVSRRPPIAASTRAGGERAARSRSLYSCPPRC